MSTKRAVVDRILPKCFCTFLGMLRFFQLFDLLPFLVTRCFCVCFGRLVNLYTLQCMGSSTGLLVSKKPVQDSLAA